MFIARCGNKINVVPLSCYALSDGNFSTEIFRLSIPKLLFYIVIVSENTYVLEAGDECVFANHQRGKIPLAELMELISL